MLVSLCNFCLLRIYLFIILCVTVSILIRTSYIGIMMSNAVPKLKYVSLIYKLLF